MRKSILVFCLVLILSYTLPLFVHADLPDNDYDSTFSFSLLEIDGSDGSYSGGYPPTLFNFGQLYFLCFNPVPMSSLSGRVYFEFSIDFDFKYNTNFYFLSSFSDWDSVTPTYSMNPHIFVNKDTSELIDTSSLTEIDSFSYSGPVSVSNFYYSFSDQSIISTTSSPVDVNSSLMFKCISSLPAGRYSFLFRFSVNSSDGSFNVPLGFFFDQTLTGNPVVDYAAGDISFSAASNALRSEIDVILNESSYSPSQQQIFLAITNSKLDQLHAVSDEKFSHVVSEFDSQSSTILDSYIQSGNTDIVPAVQQLNLSYSDSITQAVTPEQAELIHTRHSVRLSQLQAVFESNYKKELDNVLSDQDFADKEAAMNRTDELLQIESDALQIFEESDYQSYLTFVDWLHSCPDDPTVYRSIFEFIFEDPRSDVVQPFLIIPFSLVLVGVILSTTTVVFRRRS